MEQIPGMGMLVALRQGRRRQTPASRHARTPQDPGRRRRAYADGPGNLGTGPVLVAEHCDAGLDRGRRGPGTRVRPARAVLQSAWAFSAIAGQPFSRGPDRNSALPGQSGHWLALRSSGHQLFSTTRSKSGILVDVHPGLLSRVSNDLAATTFPRSAWVNNLLLRHS